MAGMIRQDIIRTPPNNHAVFFRRFFSDNVCLNGKQPIIGQYIRIAERNCKIAICRGRKGIKIAFFRLFIRIFKSFLANSALLGCQRQQFFIQISNVQRFRQPLSDFTASAAKLPVDGYHKRITHHLRPLLSMVLKPFLYFIIALSPKFTRLARGLMGE